jgi:hypothetical protein
MSPDELKEKQENKKFNLIVKMGLLIQAFETFVANHEKTAAEWKDEVKAALAANAEEAKQAHVRISALPCGEEKVKIENLQDAANVTTTWKIAIVGSCFGVVLIIAGGLVGYGELRGRVAAAETLTEKTDAKVCQLQQLHMTVPTH